MGEWFQEQAAAGSLGLAIPVAAIAGLVSFFSPCVLPLLPGYLSYATGLSGADLAAGEAGNRRGRMLLGSILFVLGFAVVFVFYGTAFGSIGRPLRRWQDELQLGLGVVLVVLGLVFAGVLSIFQRDLRIHKVPAVGLGAAPLIGALFAIGWTPQSTRSWLSSRHVNRRTRMTSRRRARRVMEHHVRPSAAAHACAPSAT